MFGRSIVFALALLPLAACQKTANPSSDSAKITSGGPSITAKSSPSISVEPSTMASCNPVVATVHWDANQAHVQTDSTEIWAGPSVSQLKLFSAGGAVGETKTGPWARPGTYFVLKNKLDGKVLGDALIGGSECK